MKGRTVKLIVMRKALATLTVLAAAVLAVPAPTATSVVAGGADRIVQNDRARVSAKDPVIELTNNRRRARGCDNLRKNAALGRAAQRHTRRMAAAERLDHRLPGEASLGVRVTRAGYRWTLVGENVAAGYRTPAAVVRGWMSSRGHRRNILDCRFRHIGAGYVVSGRGTPYWTQVFGRP